MLPLALVTLVVFVEDAHQDGLSVLDHAFRREAALEDALQFEHVFYQAKQG